MWIKFRNETHQIISCNTCSHEDIHEVWVTRPNGKNLLIMKSEDEQEINMIKDMIDHAIRIGEPIVELEE